MSGSPAWEQGWLRDTARQMAMPGAWRGILTGYFAASLKLVDDADELEVLEELLQSTTPTLHSPRQDQHPQWLATFNFRPRHASRFRRADRYGFWYGAATLDAAQSEVAYWRMMFLRDSAGCQKLELVTDHSFFKADVDGRGIDLMVPPWPEFRAVWRHPSDYTATQALAEAAEAENVQWIQYESVRAPHAALAAVLAPNALRGTTQEVNASLQEWTCKTSLERVVFANRSTGAVMAWTIDGE